MENNKIVITEQTLRDSRKKIAEELKKTKAADKEITLAQLLIEENFFRFKNGLKGVEDFSVDTGIKNFLGTTEIFMTAKGDEFNPIPEVT